MGPQVTDSSPPSENFEDKAKQRQASFRDTSLTICCEARNPTDEKGKGNPHLLARCHEEQNLYPGIRGAGGAVEFFKQRGIKWWQGSGDSSKGKHPTRNMASSQVACVNFLLPLAGILGALAAVLRAIDCDVLDVVDIRDEGRTSPVEFEWVGCGGTLEGTGTRGHMATSIDAFLVAETKVGSRRAYLLEWKYTEQYLGTKPSFKGGGQSGNTRRMRYLSRYHDQFSSFKKSAPVLDDFFYEPFYQIMRLRLLADRMIHRRELDVEEAKLVVVVPEENQAYRRLIDGRKKTSPPLIERFSSLKTVEEVMRAVLKSPDAQFDMVAPATLLDAVTREIPDETADWAHYWQNRYGV